MASRNDVTGDKIQTKPTTKEYSDNWDRIFSKDKTTCCGECNPCAGHSSASNGLEIENQKDEQNDREIQESK